MPCSRSQRITGLLCQHVSKPLIRLLHPVCTLLCCHLFSLHKLETAGTELHVLQCGGGAALQPPLKRPLAEHAHLEFRLHQLHMTSSQTCYLLTCS